MRERSRKSFTVRRIRVCFALFILLASTAPLGHAAVWYVATNGNNGAAGTNWVTAKATIQAAVDVSADGDSVLVSNGVYATGGRVFLDATTNRVAISNAITVISLNGPEVTTIRGEPSTRCAYVGTNAVLSGFTLTEGSTYWDGVVVGSTTRLTDQSGGGTWCETNALVVNCIYLDNQARHAGGGSFQGIISNCVFQFNTAGPKSVNLLDTVPSLGGGAYGATLFNCTLVNNAATPSKYSSASGGGVYSSSLHNCSVVSNTAKFGGGASFSQLEDCMILHNVATVGGGLSSSIAIDSQLVANESTTRGGGAADGELIRCVVEGNKVSEYKENPACPVNLFDVCLYIPGDGGGTSGTVIRESTVRSNEAYGLGGGIFGGSVANSLIVGNEAGVDGGGTYESILSNCTIVANTSPSVSGCLLGEIYNSIIYFNVGTNTAHSYIVASCTTPMPTNGIGNITNNPSFISTANYHLNAGSPCVDAGLNAYAPGSTDLDGSARISGKKVDVGAYEVFFLSEILILATNNHVLVDGDLTPSPDDGTEFGSADLVTGMVTRTFGITNSGPDTLFIVSNSVTGVNTADFAVIMSPGSVSAGSRSNLVVQFNPSGSGLRTAIMTIHNSDPDNSAYGFAVQGTGLNPPYPMDVWVNEVVYDPQGTQDVDEFIELAGPAGLPLTNYLLTVYDGSNVLTNQWLTGVLSDEGCGIGTAHFGFANILPNSAAGVSIAALSAGTTSLIQWVSWFNTITPVGGPAAGVASTYIGTSSSGSQDSRHLVGAGRLYGHFTWVTGGKTPGALNTGGTPGQTILPCEPDPDADGDGTPNSWEASYNLNPFVPNVNSDGDWMTDLQEYYAHTDPTNGASFFPDVVLSNTGMPEAASVIIPSSSTGRIYTLYTTTNLLAGPQVWMPVWPERTGTGSAVVFDLTNDVPARSYRTSVRLPE